MISKEEQKQILEAMKPYKPKRVGVFGSVARGENRKDSDIDIAYTFDAPFGAADHFDLFTMLKKNIGKNVDLVDFDCFDPSMKDAIMRDMKIILNDPYPCGPIKG
ncbi:MAG: nucleotidyltransferase domain-containing protein [Flavobacteriaceae bacterium]|nr:nucleotidyltransferase domain-containing protein [Flavobacteriaceae bacterium]